MRRAIATAIGLLVALGPPAAAQEPAEGEAVVGETVTLRPVGDTIL